MAERSIPNNKIQAIMNTNPGMRIRVVAKDIFPRQANPPFPSGETGITFIAFLLVNLYTNLKIRQEAAIVYHDIFANIIPNAKYDHRHPMK